MAKPILYVSELTEQEALAFIRAEKLELSEATKKLLRSAEAEKDTIKKILGTLVQE